MDTLYDSGCTYYIRDWNINTKLDLKSLESKLQKNNLIKSDPLRNALIQAARAAEVYDMGRQMLQENIYSFIGG